MRTVNINGCSFLVFDHPKIEKNGKKYTIVATWEEKNATFYTLKNEKGEFKSFEMDQLRKWLGL